MRSGSAGQKNCKQHNINAGEGPRSALLRCPNHMAICRVRRGNESTPAATQLLCRHVMKLDETMVLATPLRREPFPADIL